MTDSIDMGIPLMEPQYPKEESKYRAEYIIYNGKHFLYYEQDFDTLTDFVKFAMENEKQIVRCELEYTGKS